MASGRVNFALSASGQLKTRSSISSRSAGDSERGVSCLWKGQIDPLHKHDFILSLPNQNLPQNFFHHRQLHYRNSPCVRAIS
jgi:hypothetical protein